MSNLTQEVIHLQNTEQGLAWIKMAVAKNKLTTDLQNRELGLQQLLLNLPADQRLIDAALSTYRKKFDEMVEERKKFTNAVTAGIIVPLMEFEKRADPKVNAEYTQAAALELDLRKKAQAELTKQKDKANEIAAFKSHFKNEYSAIALSYRHELAQIIHQVYSMCLSAKTPPDNVAAAISTATETMKELQLKQPASFARTHISKEEAGSIYANIQKPDYAGMLNSAASDLNAKFEMYAHDLANAESALLVEKNAFKATIVEEVQDLRMEQAANTLVAQAETFITADPGMKGVTETTRIIIQDTSEAWVMKIITAFMANFGKAFKKVRVKKYSQLSVAQMAAALDAAGVKVEDVQYEDICK